MVALHCIKLEHDSVLNLTDIAAITITIPTKDACPPLRQRIFANMSQLMSPMMMTIAILTILPLRLWGT